MQDVSSVDDSSNYFLIVLPFNYWLLQLRYEWFRGPTALVKNCLACNTENGTPRQSEFQTLTS